MARSGGGVSEPLLLMERRKNWSEETMEMALRDVTNGVLGVRRAALEYVVPKLTLSD